jgi:RNase P/RNase MRP subunit p29
MRQPRALVQAEQYGIRSVPAVVVDGEMIGGERRGIDEALLQVALATASTRSDGAAEERREVARILTSLEASWKGIAGRHTARVSNLSTVGCYLETSQQALNREVIEVELKMPDGAWLTLQGQVIYRIPEAGFGVFFTDMDEEAREVIAEIIDYYDAGGDEERS